MTHEKQIIHTLSHSASESDDEYVYTVKTRSKRRPFTRVKVLGRYFNVVVDTGASIHVIDRKTFAKLPTIKLEQTKSRALAYDNDKPVKFLAKFDTVLETSKHYTVATFYVIDNNNLISADIGINKRISTRKWPQGHAGVEKFNQPLGKALRTAKVEGKNGSKILTAF